MKKELDELNHKFKQFSKKKKKLKTPLKKN